MGKEAGPRQHYTLVALLESPNAANPPVWRRLARAEFHTRDVPDGWVVVQGRMLARVTWAVCFRWHCGSR